MGLLTVFCLQPETAIANQQQAGQRLPSRLATHFGASHCEISPLSPKSHGFGIQIHSRFDSALYDSTSFPVDVDVDVNDT